ncbi:hypothetical protein AYI68_g3518 [Smittium mucronatum]|uniref:Uncharacterized protein n=1 Tax=Smittium mucronatum TaxID=133383 RepID=A0A1R0GZP6_9FUNG|nr:hypothetical protein AYI68_g3518 [Smittium mucronatum]
MDGAIKKKVDEKRFIDLMHKATTVELSTGDTKELERLYKYFQPETSAVFINVTQFRLPPELVSLIEQYKSIFRNGEVMEERQPSARQWNPSKNPPFSQVMG